MKMKDFQIYDELKELKLLTLFVIGGLASGLDLEIREEGRLSNCGLDGSHLISLDIEGRFNKLLESCELRRSNVP